MNNQPALSYQQASARGASPVGQVVSLYDTILRDFRRAQAAFDSGNVETRVFELNHALTVIAHLQNVLDHAQGGEAAKQFDQFYAVTRALVVELNFHPSRGSFEQLIDLYGSIRQAWHQVEQQLPASERQPAAAKPASIPIPQSSSPADEAVEAPRGNWSA
jgi:flagellar protein FliS